MKKITVHLLGISLVCFAVFTIIASGAKRNISTFKENKNGWLPSTFDPRKNILVIEDDYSSKKQSEKIEAYLQKNYPYKYEILKGSYAKTYTDETKYRWILQQSMENRQTTTTDSKGMVRTRYITVYDYNFYDRVENKKFASTGISASWPYQPLSWIVKKIAKDFP
jgi:hypothetical protein